MIDAYLEERLADTGLSRQDFSELLIRLLDYGVISRDESQTEAQLYDRFQHCAELVEDYLSVIGLRLQHDRRFAFVRLFPPGAEVPGLADSDDAPFNHGFRARPMQQEVAVILALRSEYEKALREGQVDEKGQVMLSLEGLAIAMNNLLGRPLPEGQVERRALFRRLRQLRLLRYNSEDDMSSAESWVSIQPAITSFVTAEVLAALKGETATTVEAAARAGDEPLAGSNDAGEAS